MQENNAHDLYANCIRDVLMPWKQFKPETPPKAKHIIVNYTFSAVGTTGNTAC